MTPTEREAYRKLQEEIRRRKSLGESNLIIRNGKITQYVPKKFKTRVLINNSSDVVENKDTSTLGAVDPPTDDSSVPIVVKPNDTSNDDQNDVPMIQDSITSS